MLICLKAKSNAIYFLLFTFNDCYIKCIDTFCFVPCLPARTEKVASRSVPNIEPVNTVQSKSTNPITDGFIFE